MNARQLVQSFCAKWRKKYDLTYYPNWGKDGKMFQGMLEGGQPWEEIEAALEVYLNKLDDAFLEQAGFPIALLPSSMPRIAVVMMKEKQAAKAAEVSKEHPDLANVLEIRKKLASNGSEDIE